jgi:hypothetical protein
VSAKDLSMSKESLTELLNSVESEEARASILKIYQEDLDAMEKLGVDKYNKKDGEHLKLKNAIKETGYDSDKFATLKEYIESLKDVTTKASDGDLAYKALEKQFVDMKEQLEKEKTVAKTSSIEAKLSQAIGDKYNGAELLIKTLIGDGRVDLEDGKYFFKDGENVTDFDSGIESLKETYKDLLKSDQNGGSGDGGGVPVGTDADAEFKELEARMLAD